ncbi:hypothetical protein AAC387_Pa01g3079 [Persea americana]
MLIQSASCCYYRNTSMVSTVICRLIPMLQVSVTFLFSELVVGPKHHVQLFLLGAEPSADPTRLLPVNINRDLLHLVLAVSYAKEQDQIISSNVAGFIYITDIDIQRKKITYLAPCPGELPSRYLIEGSLTWLES